MNQECSLYTQKMEQPVKPCVQTLCEDLAQGQRTGAGEVIISDQQWLTYFTTVYSYLLHQGRFHNHRVDIILYNYYNIIRIISYRSPKCLTLIK